MGRKGREIVKVDVGELVELLKKAYADEWIAYYAYEWIAKMVHGSGSPHVAELAGKIAEEEKEHADELAERILELGGELPYGIEAIYNLANCKTVEYPEDLTDLRGILKALAEAEACAIEVYNKILTWLAPCYTKDARTFHLIEHILSEEIAHEEAFENLLE